MPMQTNGKIIVALMNDKVSRRFIFKWQKPLLAGSKSLEDDSRIDRPKNVRWHNLAESLMDAYINKGTAQHQKMQMMSDIFKQFCCFAVCVYTWFSYYVGDIF